MSGHEDRQHKRFSPSQAERFFACPGSTNLLSRVSAREESPYAKEGTDAHTVLEHALRHGFRNAKEAHEDSDLSIFPLNTFDNYFYFSINAALNYVYGILDEYPDATMRLEQFITVPLPTSPGEADGYLDIEIYIPSIDTLYIIDFKHGAGVTKAAKGNKQLLQYGAGVVSAMETPPENVILVIVQPRAFHPDGIIREYPIFWMDLLYYLEELDAAVARSLRDDAELIPDDNGRTTDHCRFCDAKTICPAREAAALSVVSQTFKTVIDIQKPKFPVIHTMDLERLGMIRMYGPMLRKWLDDVNEHILELARAGHKIPGAKLVETQAKREWYEGIENLPQKLAALIGCDVSEVTTQKMITITAAESLVVESFRKRAGRGKKNKAAEDARKAFAYFTLKQSSGNLTLADETDPRPEVNRASGFGQIVSATAQITDMTGEQR
jgi:hypothetical protein